MQTVENGRFLRYTNSSCLTFRLRYNWLPSLHTVFLKSQQRRNSLFSDEGQLAQTLTEEILLPMAKVTTRKDGEFEVDRFPDKCPLCQFHIAPHCDGGVMKGKYDQINTFLFITFQCTRHQCQQLFIAYYRRHVDPYRIPTGDFRLRSVAPSRPEKPNIPAEITTLSPAFHEIYTETIAAEAHDLTQIAGAGYRKALEFLIKDYCCSKHSGEPETVDKIKGMFLGNVINSYIDDTKIQQCAKLATWLGNDEVHYVRLWDKSDLDDLKRLLNLTTYWIEAELLTDEYVSSMTPKN